MLLTPHDDFVIQNVVSVEQDNCQDLERTDLTECDANVLAQGYCESIVDEGNNRTLVEEVDCCNVTGDSEVKVVQYGDDVAKIRSQFKKR